MTTILAVAGSLRRDSFNRRLLPAASAAAPAGVRLTLWEDLDGVPAFDEDVESGPTPRAGLGVPAVCDRRAAKQAGRHDRRRPQPARGAARAGGPAPGAGRKRFDQHGNLTDDTLRHQLRQALGRLIEHADPLTARLAG
ncbi:MAG: hypothetical protein L0H64_22095 [Pseudonocardia sp.]|nr:hypothetical protein [Pseudonocardia sp.]